MSAKPFVYCLCLLLTVLIPLSGCGTGASGVPAPAAPTKVPVVGIAQFVSHPVMDDARQGVLKAFADAGYVDGKNIKFDIQNAQGDIPTGTTIAQKFRDDGVDLIIAIGTPTAQAAYKVVKDAGKPNIVFVMIVDPYGAGLAKSPTDKAAHLTGTTSLPPIEDGVKLVKETLPNAKRIGMVWNPAEQNSVAVTEMLRPLVKKYDLELVEASVSKSEEVFVASQSLLSKNIDAFFTTTDSTVAAGAEALIKVGNESKIPLVGAELGIVRRGAAAGVGWDFIDIGIQSGEMAIKILKGTSPKDIPIELGRKVLYGVNLKAAELQGIKLPDDVVKKANEKYTEIQTPSK